MSSATPSFPTPAASEPAVLPASADTGRHAGEGDPAVSDDTARRRGRRMLRRVAFAAIGAFFVLDSLVIEGLKIVAAKDPSIVSWVSDGGTLAALCCGIGIVFLLLGIGDVICLDDRRGNVRMNELVILAVLASIARANFDNGGVIALWTAGGIAFFMLITLIIESQSAVGAQSSLEALARLTPGKARRITADGEREVEPKDLLPGDRIAVRPGETVHADGVIARGLSALQEANITGEALPVDKGVGDTVFAGTLNMSGLLEVTVSRAGRDTTLGRVRDLILAAEQSRLPFVRLIDQYIRYYTPVVLMIALLVWFTTQQLTNIAALLVAACPIALILATPSAMIAALSAAARLGILIKNVNDIEAMARTDAFVMDKTGTVTKGELGVVRLAPVDGVKPADLVRWAASAEAQSNHPVAVAVKRLADKSRVRIAPPDSLHEEPGHGIKAVFGDDTIIIGNLRWMIRNGCQESDFPARDGATEGVSLLYMMRNGAAVGWLALEDQLRPGALELVRELKSLGIRHIALVTGDREGVATRVAAELEIPHVKGGCIPSEKVDYVEKIKKQGYKPVFVGDGVNDGPALAASHIGIAMGAAGSDVAVETATIALLNNRLNRLPFLIRLARQSRLVIIQNFLIGGIFIFGGMSLSAAGLLHPLAAAVVQVVSSLAVVLNSARLVRQGEDIR